MPLQASLPRSAVNVPCDYFSMAGFEVTLYGRFWVTPEGQDGIIQNFERAPAPRNESVELDHGATM